MFELVRMWVSKPSNVLYVCRMRLVGAVGIENNHGRDLKDLRGMRRSTGALKRNDRERKGILIAPLKLPDFSEFARSPTVDFQDLLP
jgi:hypothetical protein